MKEKPGANTPNTTMKGTEATGVAAIEVIAEESTSKSGKALRKKSKKQKDRYEADDFVIDDSPSKSGRKCDRSAEDRSTAYPTFLVHADIKPEKIMIAGQDGIKIIDFGLAEYFATQAPTIVVSGCTAQYC